MDKISVVRSILTDLGVPAVSVHGDTRIRADLGLDSTETTQLEIELRERSAAFVDLWDAHDYAVAELAELLPDQ